MSVNSEKVYEKYFTPEQLSNMKASSIRELKGVEERATAAIVLMSAFVFIEVIVLIATILWTTKFMIFLLIVGLMFVGLTLALSYISFKNFQNKVKEIQKELE